MSISYVLHGVVASQSDIVLLHKGCLTRGCRAACAAIGVVVGHDPKKGGRNPARDLGGKRRPPTVYSAAAALCVALATLDMSARVLPFKQSSLAFCAVAASTCADVAHGRCDISSGACGAGCAKSGAAAQHSEVLYQ